MPAMANPTAVSERVQYVAQGRERLARDLCPHCEYRRPAQLTCPVCGQGVLHLTGATLRTRWAAHLDATRTADNQPAPARAATHAVREARPFHAGAD